MQKQVSDPRHRRSSIQAARRSWFEAFQLSWNAALQMNTSQMMALKALRGLIGCVLPLVVGVATGYVVEGASIASGAVLWTTLSMTSPHRLPLRVLFVSCVSLAAGAFIGSVTGSIPLLSTLAVGVVAFAAGILVAISAPVAMIGMQSVVAVIFLTFFARDPLYALFQAVLLFAGAFFALLLEILFSPWRRTDAERKALSLSFERLTEVANATDDSLNPRCKALQTALAQSQAILFDGDDHRPQGRAFFALYGAAEQMRLLLIVLQQLKQKLQEQPSVPEEAIICLEQLLQGFSIPLQNIARHLILTPAALRKAESEEQSPSNAKIKALISNAQQWQVGSPEQQALFQDVLIYCYRMLDLLDRSTLLARTWRYPDPRVLAASTIHQHSAWRAWHNARAILKANLTYRSTSFRHAIRLGVTLALATALYHLPGFPVGRGYWIPFTAFLVLKPDFNTTLTRSVSRLIGTLGGVILATLLLTTLKPTLTELIAIVALAIYLSFSLFFVNYSLYSVFITITAVCLLAFVVPSPLTNIFDRAIDTLLGGLLALLMFLLWPTWERTQLSAILARRVDTLRNYLIAVLDTYIRPDSYQAEAIAQLHREARLAHSNVDASLARIAHEPSASHFNALQVYALLGALNSISLSALTLEGYKLNNVVLSSAMRARLSPLIREIEKTLQHLSQALTATPPGTISCTAMDAALHALTAGETSTQPSQASSTTEQAFLLNEAEQIVHAIESSSQFLPLGS